MTFQLSSRRFLPAFLALAALAVLTAAPAMAAKDSREAKVDETVPARPTSTPLMAIVSLNDQRISIYDAQGRVMRAPVSSGQTGYETPVGIYSVLQKNADHYSNIYDDAEMPFMQRLTWSGVALHAGVLPGYPASHGCVRMPHGFAEQLFGMTKIGMRVIVAGKDVAPAAISHPLLWKPQPARSDVAVASPTVYQPEEDADPATDMQPDVSKWPARQMQLDHLKTVIEGKKAEAEAARANAEEVRRKARYANAERSKAIKASRSADYVKRRADEKLASADRAFQSVSADAKMSPEKVKGAEGKKAEAEADAAAAQAKVDAAKAAEQSTSEAAARATEEAKVADAARDVAAKAVAEVERKMLPLSVFISLKTQRLYVRQGREPVLETPVTIRDAEQPIGTHIFTAVDYANDGEDVQWNVVSIGGKPSEAVDETSGKRRKSKERSAEAVPTDVSAATAALDRITIPQEALDRISQFVWPGSSLIVSDEEASKETGKGTEFVVLISGYPQGGIKKRPRPPADPYYYYYSDRDDRRRPYRGIFGWW